MVARTDRIRGGVYGLLVGDALGVPYEFHSAGAIPEPDLIEYAPPAGFARSHPGVPPGTWSDDGAHALCLLASLLERGCLDLDDLARRLIDWLDAGYMAVDGAVFDVGVQTRRAIARLRAGAPPEEAGPRGEMDNGNGSLMRVLPLALWHRGSAEELARDAMRQSLVTHGHPRAQICCALYCLWARAVAEELANAWEQAVAELRALSLPDPHRRELDVVVAGVREAPRGTGYVLDCLRSALHVQHHDSYEEVVRAAIRLGNDTDTTAAVAGGVAGLRTGIDGIPARWLEGLRGKDLVEPLLQKLTR